MMVSRVDIRGLDGVIKKLTKVRNVIGSSEFKSELASAEMKSYQLWASNVYRWFDVRTGMGFSVTGQLGRSLSISGTEKSVVFKMMPIYNNGTDYGKLLREGFGPSPGKYLPIFDARVKYGIHPGYDGRAWVKWIEWFRKNNKELYVNATHRAVNRVVRG